MNMLVTTESTATLAAARQDQVLKDCYNLPDEGHVEAKLALMLMS